jgi:hypothetical protein
MTAILSCDVFPGLDKTCPLLSPDEDVIPDKFGPNWFSHREPKKFTELIEESPLDEELDS